MQKKILRNSPQHNNSAGTEKNQKIITNKYGFFKNTRGQKKNTHIGCVEVNMPPDPFAPEPLKVSPADVLF